MAKLDWLARRRGTVYPVINGVAAVALAIGGSAHGASFGLVVYAWAMFALCTTPLLLLRRFNDTYSVLAIFMALYFLFFGALDFQRLLLGAESFPVRAEFLSPAEVAILLGAALCLGGYLAGVRLGRPTGERHAVAEWSASAVLTMGIALYTVGTAAMIYFQVFAVPEKTNLAAARGFASMGPVLTFMVMLGNLVQPLGLLMLAYGYAKYRGAFWTTLIVTIVCAQVAMGFVTDIKLQAMMGVALVSMARVLVDGRMPKAWLVAGVVFVIIGFPILQAYRVEVTGGRGLNRAQALQQIEKVVDIVLGASEKEANSRSTERAETFVERSSSKFNIEVLFAHAGSDVAFLGGSTLVAIPMAFVPRLLAPDKEDLSVGQLFNRRLFKSNDDTYISISELGEMYWNFSWTGIVLGMSLTGLLLGIVGVKFNLERGVSLTRVLILLVTVQSLCMGFGGSMSIAYVVWLRSMAAVGLLHLVFASRRGVVTDGLPASVIAEPGKSAAASGRTGGLLPAGVVVPRFPNMMR